MTEKPRYRVRAGSQRVAPVEKGVGIVNARMVFPELEAGRMARRLGNWVPSRAHVNTLVAASGKTVVARSRYLTRNNGYANSAVECFASNLVGCGIKPSWKIDADSVKKQVQDAWDEWTNECDAEGITDFEGLQRRVARELFIAGECFVRRRPRFLSDGLSVPLQLELLPTEQLPIERNIWLPNGNRVRQGIEFDRIGRRVAYHFWKVHPGDITQSQEFGKIVIVPATEILHIHDPLESGQIRGLPKMTPAIVALWMLDAYDDAELERKKTAALFSVFLKRVDPNPTFIDAAAEAAGATTGAASIDLQPGVVHTLLPNEDVTVATPADVGPGYEMFQYRNLTKFCSTVGLPYASVTGDTVKSNYGNQRAALLDMRRRMEALQHSVLVFQMCRAVARWFLDAANLAGTLSLAGYAKDPTKYLKIRWIPPRWDWIDPLKDRQAEVFAVDAGFKSRSSVIEAEGGDPIEVDNEIKVDQDRAKKLGIILAGTAPMNKVLQEAPPGGEAAPAAGGGSPGSGGSKASDERRVVGQRTVVTKHAPNGRILEFEKHDVYEDA